MGVLEQALDSRYRVIGKVRLGDLVKPVKGLSKSQWQTAHNKINQKHVDFVICTAADMAVVGVVELDDKSHQIVERVNRDEFVDQVLANAQIPILHFPVLKGYALQEVKVKLAELLEQKTIAPAQIKVEHELPMIKPTRVNADEFFAFNAVEAEPLCPKCAAKMVKRQAKSGAHAGKWFWACVTYPKCRQVVAIE